MTVSKSAAALVGAVSALSCAVPGHAAQDLFADLSDGNPREITVSNGDVRGYVTDGAASYLGIPYAAPPVGSLRKPLPLGRL